MLKSFLKIIITTLIFVWGCEDSVNENVLEKSIHLLEPNGGEIFIFNDTIPISWEYQNVSAFNLYISFDNGNSWTEIVKNLENVSQYGFHYNGNTYTNLCLIKVQSAADNSISDVSDNCFSIRESANPEIRIFYDRPSNYPNKAPISFSSDNSFLYSYAPDIWNVNIKPTNVWNVVSGQLVNSVNIRFLSSSPTQNLIVGHNLEKDSVSIWDPLTGERLKGFPTWYPFDAKLSHNGKYLAIARTRWIDIWNVETGEHLQNITVRDNPTEDNFHTIEFSPDDKIIASGNDRLRLFNVETGDKIIELNRGYAFSIKFTPDGTQIIAGGVSNVVNFWDIETGEKTLEFNTESGSIFGIDISANGEKLLIGAKGKLLLWDLTNNVQDKVIYDSGGGDFLGVSYSNNSRYVAGKLGDKIIVYGPMYE